MALPSWDTTDRLLAAAYVNNEYTRLSDYTQLRNALLAINTAFGLNHSLTTGRHLSYPSVANWAGAAGGGFSTLTAPATQGVSQFYTSLAQGAGSIAGPGFLRGLGSGATGICEILNVYKVASAVSGLTPLAQLGVGLTRLTASGGSNAFPVAIYGNVIHGPEFQFIGSTNIELATAKMNRVQTTNLAAFGVVADKALYRCCYRLASAFTNAFQAGQTQPGVYPPQYFNPGAPWIEHDPTTGASAAPSPARLGGGRIFMPPANASPGESLAFSRQFLVGAHGGNFNFVVPWVVPSVPLGPGPYTTVTGPYLPSWIVNPAFDDTNVYLDAQPCGLNMLMGASNLSLRAIMVRDTVPDATGLPTYDATNYASLYNNLREVEFTKLQQSLLRLWMLFGVEHDPASGAHMYPIDHLPGATKVFDSTVLAPSVVANTAFTGLVTGLLGSTAYSYNINPAAYVYATIQQIDASPPASGGIYLASMIGNPGSGIASVSFAVDNAKTYAVIRRKTAGSTNTFRLRVWRISP